MENDLNSTDNEKIQRYSFPCDILEMKTKEIHSLSKYFCIQIRTGFEWCSTRNISDKQRQNMMLNVYIIIYSQTNVNTGLLCGTWVKMNHTPNKS